MEQLVAPRALYPPVGGRRFSR